MPATIDSVPVDAPCVTGAPTRREWRTVLVIAVAAFFLRGALPGRMAIEHFDEGVYASNFYSGAQDPPHAYPERHLYAPPLFPALLEWSLILSGGRPHAVMWVTVCAGTLTVVVVWWGMRHWFGRGAGIAAAVIAATSEYHIAFSRMALTDVPLCLWMAASVFAGWRAVLTGRMLWIAGAAAFSTLAWWTKYNGWLTLAVSGSGTVAWLLFDRRRTVGARAALGRWACCAAATTLLWLPFLWAIPDGSSYAEISANHAKYFVGPAGWWDGLVRHAGTLRHLDGWITAIGVAAAPILAAWVGCERFTWNGSPAAGTCRFRLWLLVSSLVIGMGSLACGSMMVLAVIGTAGLAAVAAGKSHLSRGAREEHGPLRSPEGARLAAWMAAAWFIGLLAATPLYYPYPRLALPWLMSCWLAAGAVIGRRLDQSQPMSASGRSNAIAIASVLLLVSLAIPLASWRGPPLIPPTWTAWQERSQMQHIAGAILRDAAQSVEELGPSGEPRLDAVFYIYGEPALYFHLEAARDETGLRYVSSPATSLSPRDPFEVAVFLVTGPHAHRGGSESDPAVRKYQRVATYPYRPGDLVALDEYPAARLPNATGLPAEEVNLYLVHGPPKAR